MWISFSTNSKLMPPDGQDLIRYYEIRNPALTNPVREEKQRGRSITFDDAMQLSSEAIALDGPMLINNDDNFVNHYYHWIGETFLGSWRIWSHYAWRSGRVIPNFKTIAFPNQYHRSELSEGMPAGMAWEDKPGANKWFTNGFFPGVEYESRTVWEARARTDKLYRIPLAVVADRSAGHAGPSAAWKPFGDVLRMPVAADYLVTLRDRLLDGYTGPRLYSNRPRVLYLERQDSNRRLNHGDHDRLVAALQALDDEGVVKFTTTRFTGDIPFQEQVATIADTDVFIAVHGNGLTHSLWMGPDPKKLVFEMQPAICTVTDYSPLAQAAGVQHYLTHETDMCKPEECPQRGCEVSGGINTPDIRIDPRIIVDEIRKIYAN